MAAKTGIYQILHTDSGKRYIGSSTNIYRRLHHHKDRLKSCRHANDYLQKAYDKYGIDAFEFKQILECRKEDLEFYEQLIIDGYAANNRNFGYNLRKVSISNAGMTTKRNTHKAGDSYNRLTLLKPLNIVNDKRIWLCQCLCGNSVESYAGDVRRGHTKSCGCLNKERLIERINEWNKEHPEPWNKKKVSACL